jgi:hypothetical protein
MALISDFIQADKITTDLVTQLVQRKTVFGQVADVKRDFKGSSASIPVANSGTVGNYVPGTPMDINTVTSSAITIDLNQTKYINDYVDSVDKASSAQDVMRQVLNRLTQNMSITIDTYALQEWFDNAGVTDATILGVTSAAIDLSESNIDEYLAGAAQLLDENDVPEDGRVAIIPPVAHKYLTLNNVYEAASTDEQARIKGFKGMFMGLEIFVSNNLPKGVAGGLEADETGVIIAHKSALNVLFNYDDIKISTDALYRGEFISAVSQYGAGVNTSTYVAAGVIK